MKYVIHLDPNVLAVDLLGYCNRCRFLTLSRVLTYRYILFDKVILNFILN